MGYVATETFLKYNIKSLRILSRNEFNQYEMKRKFGDNRIRFLIGDIREKDRLDRAMNGVDYVIHMAALKHVPVCEYNPIEAIRTNIEGSINVIECAIDNKVEKVVAISSDKAVNPINLYGATKLCMEKLFVHVGAYVGKFSCIRFGNFINSRGSMVPLIQEQAKTGKVTLTDMRMARYWIPLAEASAFVVKVLETMEGGEIFVPRMRNHNVVDMIKEIAPGAEMEVIGRREGEKISEDLFNEDEIEKREERDNYWVIR